MEVINQSATSSTELMALRRFAHFNRAEFYERWYRARRAAIVSVLSDKQIVSAESETDLLKLVSESEHEQLLRQVFENSRKLGLSLTRFLNVVLELNDIEALLRFSEGPCCRGEWSSKAEAKVLSRAGCEQGKALGRRYCEYWREAVDGLVMGVGEEVRFVRHRSLMHGDSCCEDVFFTENVSTPELRWGPLPEDLLSKLKEMQESFARVYQAKLSWIGFSEGTLFYRLTLENGVVCGATARLLTSALKKKVEVQWPQLKIQDASPLAVYGEGK